MYIGLQVKKPLYCQILVELEYYRYIFEKYSNMKFHGNSSSGSQAVQCGPTIKQADMTKLTVAFCKFCERA